MTPLVNKISSNIIKYKLKQIKTNTFRKVNSNLTAACSLPRGLLKVDIDFACCWAEVHGHSTKYLDGIWSFGWSGTIVEDSLSIWALYNLYKLNYFKCCLLLYVYIQSILIIFKTFWNPFMITNVCIFLVWTISISKQINN